MAVCVSFEGVSEEREGLACRCILSEGGVGRICATSFGIGVLNKLMAIVGISFHVVEAQFVRAFLVVEDLTAKRVFQGAQSSINIRNWR
jgi:hypothetical protein